MSISSMSTRGFAVPVVLRHCTILPGMAPTYVRRWPWNTSLDISTFTGRSRHYLRTFLSFLPYLDFCHVAQSPHREAEEGSIESVGDGLPDGSFAGSGRPHQTNDFACPRPRPTKRQNPVRVAIMRAAADPPLPPPCVDPLSLPTAMNSRMRSLTSSSP